MSDLVIREAREEDLAAIVGLHAADSSAGHGYGDAWTEETRDDYERAFRRIAGSPDNALYVATLGGAVVGTFLLTITPGITARGAASALLRAVQVDARIRSRGIGAAMLTFAEEEARARGARFMRLNSNTAREAAHRFYLREGYSGTHTGFTKTL